MPVDVVAAEVLCVVAGAGEVAVLTSTFGLTTAACTVDTCGVGVPDCGAAELVGVAGEFCDPPGACVPVDAPELTEALAGAPDC